MPRCTTLHSPRSTAMASEITVAGLEQIAKAFKAAGNLRKPGTRRAVVGGLDDTADRIISTARRRNLGFKDRTGRLRRAIERQGLEQEGRNKLYRWLGVQGAEELNYYSRAVEYRSKGKFSYLRVARRRVFKLGRLAVDIGRRLSRNLQRSLDR